MGSPELIEYNIVFARAGLLLLSCIIYGSLVYLRRNGYRGLGPLMFAAIVNMVFYTVSILWRTHIIGLPGDNFFSVFSVLRTWVVLTMGTITVLPHVVATYRRNKRWT